MSLKYQVKRTPYCLIYYRHGEKHRIDGPAFGWMGSEYEWIQYNKHHRLDGPAKISKWYSTYFIRGQHYNEKDYELKISSSTERD